MEKNYLELGKTILALVGGQGNVKSLQHCATRLRFKIVNMEEVDTEKLKNTSGVAGIKPMKDGIHVIIGQDVENVYDEINKIATFNDTEVANVQNKESEKGKEKKQNVFIRLMTVVADCMVPMLPALVAAGLMNAVITLISSFGIFPEKGTTYQVLKLMAKAPIYFLPFMVAVGASKRFKSNIFLALATTAVMLYPTFTTLAGKGVVNSNLFGLPFRIVDYSSQLLPIILMCWFLSKVEAAVKKVTPKAISVFMVPLATYIIVTICTLIVFGPIGSYIGDYVALAVEFMVGKYNWLFGFLFAGFGNFLVASGMHYGLMPIIIANFAKHGYDTFYGGACFAGAMALAGAVLAVAVKAKDKEVKGIAASTGFTALLGISEPALYGVFFRYKSVMIATTISGAIGGFLAGLIGVNSYGMAPAGLTSIPVLIGATFVHGIIVIVLSFVLGFGISFMLYKDSKSSDKNSNETIKEA